MKSHNRKTQHLELMKSHNSKTAICDHGEKKKRNSPESLTRLPAAVHVIRLTWFKQAYIYFVIQRSLSLALRITTTDL